MVGRSPLGEARSGFLIYARLRYRGFAALGSVRAEAFLWPVIAATGSYAGSLLLAAALGMRFNASRVLVHVVL